MQKSVRPTPVPICASKEQVHAWSRWKWGIFALWDFYFFLLLDGSFIDHSERFCKPTRSHSQLVKTVFWRSRGGAASAGRRLATQSTCCFLVWLKQQVTSPSNQLKPLKKRVWRLLWLHFPHQGKGLVFFVTLINYYAALKAQGFFVLLVKKLKSLFMQELLQHGAITP